MPTKISAYHRNYINQTVRVSPAAIKASDGLSRAACYNYKCPLDDQILIYAQRPDATAVLEMERWNRQFGRWVNRGARASPYLAMTVKTV